MAPTKLSPRKLGTVAPNYSRFRFQVKIHDVQRLDLSVDLSKAIGMDEFEERRRTPLRMFHHQHIHGVHT